MQIDPITVALGSTAASTTSVNGVNNFESYLNNAGNNSLASIFQKASNTYGVSVSLLTAMAKQESNFQACLPLLLILAVPTLMTRNRILWQVPNISASF